MDHFEIQRNLEKVIQRRRGEVYAHMRRTRIPCNFWPIFRNKFTPNYIQFSLCIN